MHVSGIIKSLGLNNKLDVQYQTGHFLFKSVDILIAEQRLGNKAKKVLCALKVFGEEKMHFFLLF